MIIGGNLDIIMSEFKESNYLIYYSPILDTRCDQYKNKREKLLTDQYNIF